MEGKSNFWTGTRPKTKATESEASPGFQKSSPGYSAGLALTNRRQTIG